MKDMTSYRLIFWKPYKRWHQWYILVENQHSENTKSKDEKKDEFQMQTSHFFWKNVQQGCPQICQSKANRYRNQLAWPPTSCQAQPSWLLPAQTLPAQPPPGRPKPARNSHGRRPRSRLSFTQALNGWRPPGRQVHAWTSPSRTPARRQGPSPALSGRDKPNRVPQGVRRPQMASRETDKRSI